MGKVAIKVKIAPNEVNIDMEKFAKDVVKVLKEFGDIYAVRVEPVAFGLNVLKVTFITDSESGFNEEKAIEKLKNVEHFGSLEVEEVTLVS